MDRDNRYFDVTIIGGGLHGAAIAADCAGRGLRTLLCDQGDVGGSHNLVSTRLFHCGLQYLQRGDLSLVSESLHERTSLLQRAPHLTTPATVIIPQPCGLRSRLKINTKAWLYRLVAGQDNRMEATDISGSDWAAPLKTSGKGNEQLPAIVFEDALLDDSRLTIENLLLAEEKGAVILPATRLTQATRRNGNWNLTLNDEPMDFSVAVQSRSIINATGPDAERVQRNILGIKSRCSATNYRAGYIVVPRLASGSCSYLIEDEASHLVGVLPYQDNYSLVGPVICSNDDGNARNQLNDNHKEWLLSVISRHFRQAVTTDDILCSFAVETSAFRETPEATPTPFSQDYVLDFNCSDGRSPAVTLFGACVNMHRAIAEQVIEQIATYLDDPEVAGKEWTRNALLPGAHFTGGSLESLQLELAHRYPWLPEQTRTRLEQLYGARALDLLQGCEKLADLGSEVLPSLYEKEVQWLHDREWAQTPDAILWHRTKLGMALSDSKINEFNQWFKRQFHYQPALSVLHLQTQMNKEAS